MSGKRPKTEQILVPPLGVEQRQSTNALVIRDNEVAAALNFIRSHPREPMTIDRVLGAVNVGRRTLERRFAEATGRTVFQEIRRIQIEHVQRLLRETNWEVEQIAGASAFSTPKRLREVFREATGESPTVYRQRHAAAPIE
jgi:LacI family transcriptional regulator